MDKLRTMCKRLKNWLNPTDIYSSQRLVSLTLSFEGLFPFKIVGNASNRLLRISKFGYALAAFHMLFFLTTFILTIWRRESFVLFFFATEITRLGGHIQFVTSFVAMAIIYGSCIYSSKKIKITIDNIFKIDEKFKLLDVEINHDVGFKMNVYCVIGFMVVNLAFSFLSFVLLATAEKDKVPGFAVWTSFFVPPFIVSLIVIHFFCIACQIRQRFVYVNQVRRLWCIIMFSKFSVFLNVISSTSSRTRIENGTLFNNFFLFRICKFIEFLMHEFPEKRI